MIKTDELNLEDQILYAVLDQGTQTPSRASLRIGCFDDSKMLNAFNNLVDKNLIELHPDTDISNPLMASYQIKEESLREIFEPLSSSLIQTYQKVVSFIKNTYIK